MKVGPWGSGFPPHDRRGIWPNPWKEELSQGGRYSFRLSLTGPAAPSQAPHTALQLLAPFAWSQHRRFSVACLAQPPAWVAQLLGQPGSASRGVLEVGGGRLSCISVPTPPHPFPAFQPVDSHFLHPEYKDQATSGSLPHRGSMRFSPHS